MSFEDCSISLQGYRFPLLSKSNTARVSTVISVMQGAEAVAEPTGIGNVCLVGTPSLIGSDESPKIHKSVKDQPLIVHVDELELCKCVNELNPSLINSVKCVCMFQDPQSVERPFGCEGCNKRFRQKYDQELHFSDVHLKIRLVCPECEIQLGSRRALRRYQQRLHGAKVTVTAEPDAAPEEEVEVQMEVPLEGPVMVEEPPEPETNEEETVRVVEESEERMIQLEPAGSALRVEEIDTQGGDPLEAERLDEAASTVRNHWHLLPTDNVGDEIRYHNILPSAKERESLETRLNYRIGDMIVTKEPIEVESYLSQALLDDPLLGYAGTLALGTTLKLHRYFVSEMAALREECDRRLAVQRAASSVRSRRKHCTESPRRSDRYDRLVQAYRRRSPSIASVAHSGQLAQNEMPPR